MTVVVYQSTDASAPTLTGQVGSLVALLDACLVNGYGSKSAAGWTKSFSGTNTATYKQGTGSNGFYLAVNDNAPSTAQEARVCGWEVATAAPTSTNLGTGTNPFPTTTQASNGLFVRKSASSNSTARAWVLLADATCFYLFVQTGDQTYASTFAFGDFFANASSDPYSTMIQARTSENTIIFNSESFPGFNTNFPSGTINGCYIARSWTGTGTAVAAGKGVHYGAANSNNLMGGSSSNVNYPNGPDGGLLTCPVQLGHGNGVRGYLKGVWCPLQSAPLNHLDTYSGTGNQAGKTFIALAIGNGNSGMVMMETSNTWS